MRICLEVGNKQGVPGGTGHWRHDMDSMNPLCCSDICQRGMPRPEGFALLLVRTRREAVVNEQE